MPTMQLGRSTSFPTCRRIGGQNNSDHELGSPLVVAVPLILIETSAHLDVLTILPFFLYFSPMLGFRT